MTTNRILSLAVTGAFFLLASCGGNDGVELGPFAAITATEGDAPIKLTAPTSKSPAAFSYSSSNESVGRIQGDTIIVGVAGTSTITARQGELGSYYPTSTTTTLTVAARVCTAPLVRDVNGACVAPPTTASQVTHEQLAWSPATFVLTWAEADAYCKNLTVNGLRGWKLPDQAKLVTLAGSGILNGQGWTVADAWTATAGSGADSHFAVNLASGTSNVFPKESKAYVTCVRAV